VHLVQIDGLDAHALEAGVALSADALGLQTGNLLLLLIPEQAALRGDVRPVLRLSQRLTDQLFRMAKAIGGSRVDPVDASIDRRQDRAQGFFIVLRAPAELPRTAHRPRAQADGGQRHIGIAQFAFLHVDFPNAVSVIAAISHAVE